LNHSAEVVKERAGKARLFCPHEGDKENEPSQKGGTTHLWCAAGAAPADTGVPVRYGCVPVARVRKSK